MTRRPQGFALTAEPPSARSLARDLWASRGLVSTLARKEFLVRYRRASFGVLWVVALPLLQAALLTVIFSRLIRVRANPAYPIFVYSGMIAWSYFSAAVGTGATAIVDGSGLASRIYFPRAVLPLVSVVAGVYSFAISLVLLLVLSIGFHVALGLHTLLLVPATVLMVLLTAGLATFAAALHVYFRDVRFILQAGLVAWFYVTPIFYPLGLLTGYLHTLVLLNPMTGVVELFRAATVGRDPGSGISIVISAAWAVLLLVAAAVMHTRYDRLLSDLL